MKELGREKLIERVINDRICLYRRYCKVPGCKYEDIGVTISRPPMFAYPGGTPSCPECAKKKRAPIGLENAYGNMYIECYELNAEMKEK